jgi:hypothetical protein
MLQGGLKSRLSTLLPASLILIKLSATVRLIAHQLIARHQVVVRYLNLSV